MAGGLSVDPSLRCGVTLMIATESAKALLQATLNGGAAGRTLALAKWFT